MADVGVDHADDPAVAAPATRRELTPRQLATFTALLDAALDLIREDGYDTLTVRLVATRAGVTHTTAYAYFSSKEQLVATVFWHQLSSLTSPPPDLSRPTSERIAEALADHALLFDREPALSRAALAALLSADADATVVRLRDAVGGHLVRTIHDALGPDADSDGADTLLLTFSGAMLQAGMGYFRFSEVVERMATAARLLSSEG